MVVEKPLAVSRKFLVEVLTLMNGSYFTKFERYQPHPNYPLVDSSLRGSSGPVRIGYFNTETDKAKDFIKACTNVGIPFTPDFHGPSGTMGVSRVSHFFCSVSLPSEYQLCQNRSVSVWPRLLRKLVCENNMSRY